MLPLLTPALLALLPALAPVAQDPDRDGDGLSDFQEQHKYGTDPDRADSDGDGTPDGDWNERREFTYSIRTVVRVMPPVNEATLNDDYQDALVLQRDPKFVELEVVHYPLNTCAEAIAADPDWRQHRRGLEESLAPGPTTNWDADMREDLRAQLAADGIDVDTADDRTLVEEVARWALQRAESLSTFTTYLVHADDGQVAVYPGLEDKFERKKYRQDWSVEDQLQHEVLGRQMYYHRTRGTCTSSAVYLTTVLRAAGIPARMILAIPAVDASNPDELNLVEHGLTNHEVKATVLRGLRPLKDAFAAHTFNEVFVGGRWRRLNYDRLGQNILDAGCFGLLTKVHTFNDLCEAGLAPTWGTCSLTGWNSPVFQHSNPYSARSVDDRFGVHADLANPPAQEREHQHATITRAYWYDSDARPDYVPADGVKSDGSGHVLLTARPWNDDDGASQYSRFYDAVDKAFVLKAQGHPDVRAEARRGFWRNQFYLQIEAGELARMRPGVVYTLHARNRNEEHRWILEGEVTLTGRASNVTTVEREHANAVITAAYWFHSPQRPDHLGADAVPVDDAGHVLLHARDWNDEEGAQQYLAFYDAVDKRFDLVAPADSPTGAKDLRAEARRGYWRNEFYVQIPPDQYAQMQEGVPYKLVPRNGNPAHRWILEDAMVLVKQAPRTEHETLTLVQLRSPDDPSLPDWVREGGSSIEEGGRMLLAHVAEWIPGRDGDQLKEFTGRADPTFYLEAKGKARVEARMRNGCVNSGDGRIREVLLVIDRQDARRIRRGVAYSLRARNDREQYRWQVLDGLTYTWNE